MPLTAVPRPSTTATQRCTSGGISAPTSSRWWPRSTPKVVIFLRRRLGPHSRWRVSRHFLWLARPQSAHSYPCQYTYESHSRHLLGFWILRNLCELAALERWRLEMPPWPCSSTSASSELYWGWGNCLMETTGEWLGEVSRDLPDSRDSAEWFDSVSLIGWVPGMN